MYNLKFQKCVQYKTAILMFHLFHGTLPIHLLNRLCSTTRSTRRINTFAMVQATYMLCGFLYNGVKLWNSLSNNLRDCNTVIIFLVKSQEIRYFNLLVTVLVFSATISCFHMFVTL